MRRLKIDENFVKKLNAMRIDNLNGQYNLTAIKELFKKYLDIYLSGTWVMYLLRYKVINSVKIGKKCLYSFTTFPVHIEKVKNMYADIVAYNKEHYNKKKQVVEEPIVVEVSDPISEAIKLLKENGYRIYKQKITFEEV